MCDCLFSRNLHGKNTATSDNSLVNNHKSYSLDSNILYFTINSGVLVNFGEHSQG